MAETVGLLASVVQLIDATAKTYKYVRDVKNAPKERSQLGFELAHLLPTLEEFRGRIENADPNDPITKDCLRLGTADGPLKNIIVVIESLRDRLKAGKGFAALGKRLIWTLEKRDVQDAVKRIESFKTLLALALQNESIRLSQAIKADTISMPILVKQVGKLHDRMNLDDTISQAIKADTNSMPILVEQVDKLHDRMDLDEKIREVQDDVDQRHRVAGWLSSLDFGNSHRSALSNRTDGTGQWFLETQEFQDWVAEPRATLNCPGIPGAGKTIITAIAIVHLQEIYRTRNVLVLYVYCYHKEESLQNLVNLLCGFLKQTLYQSHAIPDAIKKLWHRYAMTDDRPSISELTSALVSILSSNERSFLVVDALDEYSQTEHIRNAFLDFLSFINEHCNLMITSRPAIAVSNRFPKARHLEIRARETDVRRYVRSQIPMLAKCVRLKAELQKLIEDTIVESVDGMFLLAQLYMQSLTDKLHPRKIKAALATFPKESGFAAYNAAYDETLSRITTQAPGFRDLAFKAISWITLAQRSLTIRELEHALAVEPEDKDFDPDNIHDIEVIRSVCAGLVVFDEETGTARFVHYTTQEYFRGGSHEFLNDAHHLLASTSMTYLLFEGVLEDNRWEKTSSGVSTMTYYYPVHKYALLNYASQFWSLHTRNSEPSDTIQHALRLLNDQEHLMNVLAINWELVYRAMETQGSSTWYWSLVEHGSGIEAFPRYIYGLSHSRLCTAASLGLLKVVEILIAQGADVNQEKVAGPITALHHAVVREHEGIVALLLEEGADPNLSPKEGIICAPLYIAARLGSEYIVKLLVDRGADVMWKSYMGETPLNIAISKGHLSIAKYLLQKSRGSVYLPALLCKAARNGETHIAAWLLDLGVDVQAPENYLYGPSAIDFAVNHYHNDMAKLLFHHGANLCQPVLWDWMEIRPLQTLLQRAASAGNLSTVEFILSFGPHPDHPAGECIVTSTGSPLRGKYKSDTHSPLFYACALGPKNINTFKNSTYDDPLHFYSAYYQGQYYRIAEALLAQGADVNTYDDDGVSPLHFAALTEHALMVQLLLDYGASVNQKDIFGRTALHIATLSLDKRKIDRMDSTRIIEMLIEHGAEDTEMPTDNALEESEQQDEQIVENPD